MGERMVIVNIIIPIYNEAFALPELIKSLQHLSLSKDYKQQIIFVDDGSTDKTYELLAPHISEKLQLIQLKRNFGQTAAFAAGFDHAQGEIIVTLDGDLQNDPQDITLLLQALESGADVASGWRKHRKDPLLRMILSRIANFIISKLTGIYLHDYGCSLKAYRAEYLKGFTLYGEMHRFIPIYAALEGAQIKEVIVQHYPRKQGKSKYGYDRIFKVFFDLLTIILLSKYSTKPAYFFGSIGVGLFGLASCAYIETVFERFYLGTYVHNNPFFLIGILFSVIAVQIILFGVLAEVNIRNYYDATAKKTYRIKKIYS